MAKAKKGFNQAIPEIKEVEIPREFIGTMLIADPFYPGSALITQEGGTEPFSLEKKIILPIFEFSGMDDVDDQIIGVMINVQDMDVPDMQALAKEMLAILADDSKNQPCLFGGTINADSCYMLTYDDYSRPEGSTLEKVGPLMLSWDSEDFMKAIDGKGPDQYVVVSGVFQWTRSELVEQIERGMMHVIDMMPELLFDVPIEKRWEVALQQIGYDINEVEKMKTTMLPQSSYDPMSPN